MLLVLLLLLLAGGGYKKIIIIKEETLVLQDCVCNFVMGFFGAVHLKKKKRGGR